MKTVAIAQARMGSTRVPGKVMRELDGIPVLQWTLDALSYAAGIDEVVLATSTEPADDIIEIYCKNHYIQFFRGSESDVLDRFYQCAKQYKADIVLRLTCDCPFLDSNVVSEVIRLRTMTNADYASNVHPPTYPDGLDVECFTFAALEAAHREAVRPSDRDCVTPFIVRNRSRFKAANLACPLPGLHRERWVLDTEADWQFCNEIMNRGGGNYLDILDILDQEPELRNINNETKGTLRNERLYDTLASEQLPPRTFERSQRIFQRAIQTIPFGAQTFSKSHLQYPQGRSPLFVSHGDGARVFDVDGNEYVDLVSALLPVVLGYRDPDVDDAIRRQLDSGISFSLATELEAELAEHLCRLIPCADMVKFGKTGTDVTTAAVRLARAYTDRDHILVGGYHGWADWSMSVSERNLGIPKHVRILSEKLAVGDKNKTYLQTELIPNEIAAIIVEPNSDPEYLSFLREHCTEFGIVLIFDEIITGFRWDMGGAQKLFGVTPDLATFGKSMANGMPISALVGRRDIMKLCEPPNNIFYSGTFFGETLSIAAAIATIKKMEECNVIGHLWNSGAIIEGLMAQAILKFKLSDVVKTGGEAPRISIDFNGRDDIPAEKIRSFFMAKMIQEGVLVATGNNISYAHKVDERKRIRTAYYNTFEAMAAALHDGSMRDVVVTKAQPVRAKA